MWSFMGQTVEDRSHITRSSVKSIFALFILYQVKLCTLNSFLSFSHLLWRFLKVATRVNNNKRTFVRILSKDFAIYSFISLVTPTLRPIIFQSNLVILNCHYQLLLWVPGCFCYLITFEVFKGVRSTNIFDQCDDSSPTSGF